MIRPAAFIEGDPDTLAAARHELGARTLAVQGDVTRRNDLERFFATVAREFDGLDGVFVNAGIAAFAPIETVTDEQIAALLLHLASPLGSQISGVEIPIGD